MKLFAMLFLFTIVGGQHAFSYDFSVNGIFYNKITSSTVEVTHPETNYRYYGEIIIPESIEYDGIMYSVTSIGESAFQGCTGLTSVTIPNSITHIGDVAFYDCSSLDVINGCKNVTSIGTEAFLNTAWRNALTKGMHYVGHVAYRYSGEMPENTNITLNEGTTQIADQCFSGCSNLTSITIPNSVTSIGKYGFSHCKSLTSVAIPNSVTSIGYWTFRECRSLTSVTIPNSVTSIAPDAFDGTPWYESFEEGVIYMGKVLFKYKGKMPDDTEIIIKEGTVTIGDYAFEGYKGLSSISIPNSVTSIGGHAFQGCSGLTSVTIPNSVTSIGNSAFNGCKSLTSVAIPNSVKKIDGHAFEGCKSLTSVTIPNSVTEICAGAFMNCSGLTSVNIPNSVTSIGWIAFYGCNRLVSVTLPEKVASIGPNVFFYDEGGNHDVQHKLYTQKGSATLLALWINGYAVYDVDTQVLLEQPTVRFSDITQTTVIANVENYYDEYVYTYLSSDDGECEQDIQGGSCRLTGFLPGNTYKSTSVISQGNLKLYVENPSFTTVGISPVINVASTASSVSVMASYTEGDAKVVGQTLTLAEESVADNNLTVTGLNPATKYVATYTIDVEYGTENKQILQYRTSKEIFTEPLEWKIAQPKVVSLGNVIVSTETNVDEDETNVGFEWRCTDWTEEFPSNTGTAYPYDGTIEGYIKNMNTNKLWKYRPYYLSDSGVYHYGDWMGVDPTNTSYFEPTVHTYSKVTIKGNTALVKGYALSGTDEVKVQGFKYWKTKGGSGHLNKVVAVPTDATTVELNNKQQSLSTTLSGLEYDSEYCCVAFVTTTDGNTFYGEEQKFITGANPTGIESIDVDNTSEESSIEVARYNMNGQQIDAPQKGVNIIRMSDGTTKKVYVK